MLDQFADNHHIEGFETQCADICTPGAIDFMDVEAIPARRLHGVGNEIHPDESRCRVREPRVEPASIP